MVITYLPGHASLIRQPSLLYRNPIAKIGRPMRLAFRYSTVLLQDIHLRGNYIGDWLAKMRNQLVSQSISACGAVDGNVLRVMLRVRLKERMNSYVLRQ
jgi:hypothetical protein